eukprot:250649-Rhodomonas_salina.2
MPSSKHEDRLYATHQEGGLSDGHASEVGDHGLVVDKRLHAALRDLSLVRRVGSVPARVLDDVAEDGRRGDGVVVAHADVRLHLGVLLNHAVQAIQRLHLRERLANLEWRAVADRGRDRLVHELVNILDPKDLAHVSLLSSGRAVVPALELIIMLEPRRARHHPARPRKDQWSSMRRGSDRGAEGHPGHSGPHKVRAGGHSSTGEGTTCRLHCRNALECRGVTIPLFKVSVVRVGFSTGSYWGTIGTTDLWLSPREMYWCRAIDPYTEHA